MLIFKTMHNTFVQLSFHKWPGGMKKKLSIRNVMSMSTITRLQFLVWKAHTRIKGRWKILYVFVPSVTTLKCPISSQATEDVFYFHFSFSKGHAIRQLDWRPFWKSYSGWRCARLEKVTTGLMWVALVMSSLGALSCALTGPRAGGELWYLDTVTDDSIRQTQDQTCWAVH